MSMYMAGSLETPPRAEHAAVPSAALLPADHRRAAVVPALFAYIGNNVAGVK